MKSGTFCLLAGVAGLPLFFLYGMFARGTDKNGNSCRLLHANFVYLQRVASF